MKINKLVITIFFSAVGLFVSTALQAQEAKTLFVNMPDSLSPLLTKVNREDCIDFLESKMKAQVENRFGKKSEMTDLGKDYIRMQMSVQSTWQMKVLALNDSTNVICTVSTACAPACDSSIRFYTDDWKPLTTSLFITLPVMGDFLNTPDSAGVYEFDEARRSAPSRDFPASCCRPFQASGKRGQRVAFRRRCAASSSRTGVLERVRDVMHNHG